MCFKLPIEELFYQGKNPRTRGHRKTTTTTTSTSTTAPTVIEDDSDDYDDIWGEYFDYDPEELEEEAVTNQTVTTAPQLENTDYVKELPRGIYCDLVTTLDKRCFE